MGAVIFLGLGVTYGMNFLYQGAGQSGRDGRCSWAVVLLQDEPHQFAMPHDGLQDGDDPQCLVESRAWLQAHQCRRLGFTMLYDNATVSCADLPDAHFCDFCEPQSKLVVELKKKFIPPLIFWSIDWGSHGPLTSIAFMNSIHMDRLFPSAWNDVRFLLSLPLVITHRVFHAYYRFRLTLPLDSPHSQLPLFPPFTAHPTPRCRLIPLLFVCCFMLLHPSLSRSPLQLWHCSEHSKRPWLASDDDERTKWYTFYQVLICPLFFLLKMYKKTYCKNLDTVVRMFPTQFQAPFLSKLAMFKKWNPSIKTTGTCHIL